MSDAEHEHTADIAAAPGEERGPSLGWRGWAGRTIWWAIPAFLSLILMAPRLSDPQFGLLDDGLTLQQGARILEGEWGEALSAYAGRSRLATWLLTAGILSLSGAEPAWFYAANALMLVVLTLEVMWLVRLEGGSRLQASMTGGLLVLAGPTVEAFYTLSKGEGLQLIFLILSLVCLGRYGYSLAPSRRRWALFGAAVAGVLGLLAKETSVVALPLSGVWLLLEWLAARHAGRAARLARRRAYFVASLIGLPLVVLIVRGQVVATQSLNVYTGAYQVSWAGLLSAAIRIAGWLLRDFPYLLPLGIALVVVYARKRLVRPALLLEGVLWMAAWAAVFLPWPFIAEYYLLPAAAGAAMAAGAAIDAAWVARSSLGAWKRTTVHGMLGLSFVALLTTIPNNVTSARVQLAVDAANADILAVTANIVPRNARLLVNLQNRGEYFDMIGIFLSQQLGRPGLEIEPLDPSNVVEVASAAEAAYVLSPSVSGKPYFTVRVGVGEAETRLWNESLLQAAGDDLQLVFETGSRFSRLNIDLPAALCPVLQQSAFCATTRPVIDAGTFSYGWRLYEVREP